MSVKTMIPFIVTSEGWGNVSFAARLTNKLFGAPNIRRANGVVSARFDIAGAFRRIGFKLFGWRKSAPVFSLDRIGAPCAEALPRIWLSERVTNTSHDDGRRVFTESYPTVPDFGGRKALELGDRYLGEGANRAVRLASADRIECFKAAEILYLHALRRGSRQAAARLKMIYDNDLCEGNYWATFIESRAKHARRRLVS